MEAIWPAGLDRVHRETLVRLERALRIGETYRREEVVVLSRCLFWGSCVLRTLLALLGSISCSVVDRCPCPGCRALMLTHISECPYRCFRSQEQKSQESRRQLLDGWLRFQRITVSRPNPIAAAFVYSIAKPTYDLRASPTSPSAPTLMVVRGVAEQLEPGLRLALFLLDAVRCKVG
jgi:hypothetical protein